jgi:hypothetical protein
MFRCLQRRMDRLEQRVSAPAESAEPAGPAKPAESTEPSSQAEPISVEFDGQKWEI